MHKINIFPTRFGLFGLNNSIKYPEHILLGYDISVELFSGFYNICIDLNDAILTKFQVKETCFTSSTLFAAYINEKTCSIFLNEIY